MNKNRSILAGLAGLLMFAAGCAAILPGHDKVVVNAQRTLASSRDTVDSFLRAEKFWVATHTNAVELSITANKLRDDYPPAERATLDAIAVYKANKAETNQVALSSTLNVLSQLVVIATKAHAEIAGK